MTKTFLKIHVLSINIAAQRVFQRGGQVVPPTIETRAKMTRFAETLAKKRPMVPPLRLSFSKGFCSDSTHIYDLGAHLRVAVYTFREVRDGGSADPPNRRVLTFQGF